MLCTVGLATALGFYQQLQACWTNMFLQKGLCGKVVTRFHCSYFSSAFVLSARSAVRNSRYSRRIWIKRCGLCCLTPFASARHAWPNVSPGAVIHGSTFAADVACPADNATSCICNTACTCVCTNHALEIQFKEKPSLHACDFVCQRSVTKSNRRASGFI